MATESQRKARNAWNKRNAEKNASYRMKHYYKRNYGMTKEEAATLGCVRYLFR